MRVVYNRVAYDDENLKGVAKEGGGDMPQVRQRVRHREGAAASRRERTSIEIPRVALK